MLRQLFPKQHDFNRVSNKEIENVMYLLNNRLRKCLGLLTPDEISLILKLPHLAVESASKLSPFAV